MIKVGAEMSAEQPKMEIQSPLKAAGNAEQMEETKGPVNSGGKSASPVKTGSPSLTERIRMLRTNIWYKLKYNKHWPSCPSVKIGTNCDPNKPGNDQVNADQVTFFAGAPKEPLKCEKGMLLVSEQMKNIYWFTYRRYLIPFDDQSANTTDTGWGCLVRVAQMLLAFSLNRHYNSGTQIVLTPKDILTLFIDNETNFEGSPFSIRNIVTTASREIGLKIGDWFKGSTISLTLGSILDNCQNPQLKKIRIVPCIDSTIFLDEIDNSFKKKASPGTKKEDCPPDDEIGLIILLSSVLGSEDYVNPEYYEVIKDILRIPYSTGILGGEAKKALYFFGYQGNRLLYLDPHYVQDAVNCKEDLDNPAVLNTFRPTKFHLLEMKYMQTSTTFAFLVKNRKEFDNLKEELQKLSNKHGDAWFISIMDSKA